MPIIPKIAGTASALASLNDIHKTAMIYSHRERNKVMGNSVVSSSLGAQKADYVSCKDAQRKNWADKVQFMFETSESIASVKGYLQGASKGIARYLPKFSLAALSIIPKGKILPYISTIALAGCEIWDFLKNGTGLFEKTDYLERKE